MKFLAVLLVTCIVFLSSSSGMQNTVQLPAVKMCCENAAAKDACHKSNNESKKDNCGKEGCPMLLNCSICGFLMVPTLAMAPKFSCQTSKPISHYKIGDLSAYHANNWKPPKT